MFVRPGNLPGEAPDKAKVPREDASELVIGRPVVVVIALALVLAPIAPAIQKSLECILNNEE